MTRSTASLPLLVLDTNVVLDWLYFADPGCESLVLAIRSREVRWIATPAMRGEIEHVLGRGIRARRPVDATAILEAWDRWASMTATPGGPPAATLRCTDPDDQKFIDLALQAGASALLTRDRAVLKLARRARAHGLRITTTAAWQQQRLHVSSE
jgi:predicted nucleic acid-binding protein